MARLTSQDIKRVAQLAKLEIPEAKLDAFLIQFNEILGYVEKLEKLDTSGIEPTSQVAATGLSIGTPLAADAPLPSLTPDQAIQNAPAKQDHLFKVPRIIESEG